MIDNKELKEDVLNFLQENSTAIVATVFKNRPRVSTVYFFVDDEFNFYFATKRKTSKYINISINPEVAVVVGTGPEHISVQAHGTADLIVNEEEKERLINMLVGKQNLKGVKLWPIDELKNLKDSYKVLFKVVPDELVYMNMDSQKHSGTVSNDFVKII